MRDTKRRATSKAAGLARARLLYKANLWWLEGYPLGSTSNRTLQWKALPSIVRRPPECLALEPDTIRKATYTAKKLHREFPRAFPRIVGNTKQWMSQLSNLLNLIKKASLSASSTPGNLFHLAGLYPENLRRRALVMERLWPNLQSLLEAMSWIYLTTPRKLKIVLDWTEEKASDIETILRVMQKSEAIPVLIRLQQIVLLEGKGPIDFVITVLANRRIHQVPMVCTDEYLRQITDFIQWDTAMPPSPHAELGRELALLCEWLMQVGSDTRGRLLRMLDICSPETPLDSWACWWEQTHRLIVKRRQMSSVHDQGKFDEQEFKEVIAIWEEHKAKVPDPLRAEEWVGSLQMLATRKDAALHQEIFKTLRLIPRDMCGGMLRSKFLMYWSSLIQRAQIPDARLATLLQGFRRYLKRASVISEAWLRPWRNVYSARRQCFAVEDSLLEEDVPATKTFSFYELLASVASAFPEGLNLLETQQLCRLYNRTGTPELAGPFFESLYAASNSIADYDISILRLASYISRDDPETFGSIAEAIRRLEEKNPLPPEARITVEALCSAGQSPLIREFILTSQFVDLLDCGRKLVLLKAAGHREIPQPMCLRGDEQAPQWAMRLPESLHASLAALSAVDPGAEQTASNILSSDFPDPRKLNLEIISIQKRIETLNGQTSEYLQRRLAGLKERAIRTKEPGIKRLENLKAKLVRATQRAMLLRWKNQLDELLGPCLKKLIGIDDIPGWLVEPRNLAILASAATLPEAHRKLAYRLFRKRAGTPPWDLREDDANDKFLESVSKRGIDVHPWLDGIGLRTVQGGNGRMVRLALENDPLEIFLMGSYFQTCLSPGAMNFFSVFANAADINKRVLYAFGSDDRVVGRCLLALTSEGRILMFHPYCHDSNLHFDHIVLDFTQELATQMNTMIVPRGKVQPLVATTWYDDGPLGLAELYPFLQQDSSFRKSLERMNADQFVPELLAGLRPLQLNELTLPNILALHELRNRPDLVVPLLPYIERAVSLPDEVILTAASLTEKAGMSETARRMFGKRILRSALERYHEDDYLDNRAIEFLLRVSPPDVLTVLRRTRSRGVRRWIEEKDPLRLWYAAEAMRTSHQSKLAFQLIQRLLTMKSVPENLRNLAAARSRQGNL